jgi:hypothetical protein
MSSMLTTPPLQKYVCNIYDYCEVFLKVKVPANAITC